MQYRLGCCFIQEIIIFKSRFLMHMDGVTGWIEVSPQLLVNGYKQTANLPIVSCWHDFADIIGSSCRSYVVSVLGGSPFLDSLKVRFNHFPCRFMKGI